LTISKLKRWSINYYIDTAQAAEHADSRSGAGRGGLERYYSERETRTPAWLLAGDTYTVARLLGLNRRAARLRRCRRRAGGALARRWHRSQEGRMVAHSGGAACGFDLTFCAPKSSPAANRANGPGTAIRIRSPTNREPLLDISIFRPQRQV
jgi:hypothetical protein